MLRGVKINTAILICLVFVFRILFINNGLLAGVGKVPSYNPVQKQFSSVLKRNTGTDVQDNSKDYDFSALEICEESAGDENPFKLNPFILIHVFYSPIESKLKDTLKKITPFNKYFSFDSSNRYLEYRVFRI